MRTGNNHNLGLFFLIFFPLPPESGELLTVGGKDTKQKSVSTVHKYSPFTDSWEVISYMPTARSNCLVALLSTDELMVIGGESHLYETDTTTLIETAEL